RREAAWALGRLGEGRAVAPLRRALADADPDVRWFAAWALARITGRSLDDVLAATTAGGGGVLPISNEQD
ncbi:MAG: HEAT repeat domain-containing protein, partial [Alphaproteobacteria bacterium]